MLSASVRLTCFALTLLAATAAGAAESAARRDAASTSQSDERGPGDDDDDDDSEKSYTWGLGVGAMTQQQAYKDIDRDNMALPLIYFENRWVELFGPWLDLKLPGLEWGEEQELSFAVRTQLFGFDGYEAKDAPILSGMEERKEGFLVGPLVEWSNPYFTVTAEWMFDAASESKGQSANVSIERSFDVGQHWKFTPSIAATWLDKKYADYYYGVRAAEARADRPAYFVDSTVNAEVSLRTDYMIDRHQTAFLMAGYTALGSEIKDSPLIDDSGETMVLLGYLYIF